MKSSVCPHGGLCGLHIRVGGHNRGSQMLKDGQMTFGSVKSPASCLQSAKAHAKAGAFGTTGYKAVATDRQ